MPSSPRPPPTPHSGMRFLLIRRENKALYSPLILFYMELLASPKIFSVPWAFGLLSPPPGMPCSLSTGQISYSYFKNQLPHNLLEKTFSNSRKELVIPFAVLSVFITVRETLHLLLPLSIAVTQSVTSIS